MLLTVVLLPTLALSALGSSNINRRAAVEELHAEQTAVVGVETKVVQDSKPNSIWAVEKREDDPDSGGIWAVEKREDDPDSGGIWAVEKREDDPDSGGIWAVEKRAAQRRQRRFNLGDEKGAQATAKTKQLKRARYSIP